MPFANTRIYHLGNDFEAKHCVSGWLTTDSKTKSKNEYRKIATRRQSPNYMENRRKTVLKAKANIRRKVKKYRLDRFFTFTFADNFTDVGKADQLLRNFIKRVNRRYPEFKYVGTREFQERGAVHYHLAVNTYIPFKELEELWGHGYVFAKREKYGRNKLTNYLCKYLTKHSDDERLAGFHIYLCAQGLNIIHTDKQFNSREEFLEYLETTYGNISVKFIGYYEDIGLTVVI